MNCPGCATEMTHLAFEGRLGTTIEIDLCAVCRVIWFDRFEELGLAPGATLKVFGLISEPAGRPTTLFPAALHCPRCNGRLLLTHDMQRSTPFQYWRCDSGHGRLITFVDFLREKDFVRPLTPQQLEELRQNIQTINCSNCGAAINLVKDSVWSPYFSISAGLMSGRSAWPSSVNRVATSATGRWLLASASEKTLTMRDRMVLEKSSRRK